MNLLEYSLVKTIVVVSSDTPAGEDIGAEELRFRHLLRGWADIGYHFIVRLDGSVEQGRDLKFQGAHAPGYLDRSVSVCYIGGLLPDGTPGDTRTPRQKEALRRLLRRLRLRYHESVVVGLRDLPRQHTQNPGFDAKKEYKI